MRQNKIDYKLALIFAIYLNPIGFRFSPMACYAFLYGAALLYMLLNYQLLKVFYLKMDSKCAALLLMCFVLFFCAAAVPILHGTDDFHYIPFGILIFRKLFLCSFLMLLTIKRHRENGGASLFMLYYALGTCCYVLCSVLFLLLPALKQIWLDMITPMNSGLLLSFGYVARFGWSGFSGFRNTADCTLSIIFVCHYYHHNKKELSFSRYLVILLLCLLGNMFYGRTGLLASAFCLIIALPAYHQISVRQMTMIMLAAIFVVGAITVLRTTSDKINELYIWAITPFKNLLMTGSFHNASADTLLHKMTFRTTVKTFLIGDGWITDPNTGAYYMKTDSGIMRLLLFGGVGMSALAYLTTLGAIARSQRGSFIYKLMMVAAFILFEIKGDYYYEIIPIMLAIAIAECNIERRKIIDKKMIIVRPVHRRVAL